MNTSVSADASSDGAKPTFLTAAPGAAPRVAYVKPSIRALSRAGRSGSGSR
jgi:hypothetical protein